MALTHYTLLGALGGYYLYALEPITGRSHQLRIQLASRNCPVSGDLKYGAKSILADKSIALHCFRLVFDHPTTKKRIEAVSYPPSIEPWNKFKSLIRSI